MTSRGRRWQHACGYVDRAFDVVAGLQRLVDAVGHGQLVDHSQVQIAKPGQFRAQFFPALWGDATGRFPARNENDREAQVSKLVGTAGKQCLCVVVGIPGVGVGLLVRIDSK